MYYIKYQIYSLVYNIYLAQIDIIWYNVLKKQKYSKYIIFNRFIYIYVKWNINCYSLFTSITYYTCNIYIM